MGLWGLHYFNKVSDIWLVSETLTVLSNGIRTSMMSMLENEEEWDLISHFIYVCSFKLCIYNMLGLFFKTVTSFKVWEKFKMDYFLKPCLYLNIHTHSKKPCFSIFHSKCRYKHAQRKFASPFRFSASWVVTVEETLILPIILTLRLIR